MLTGFAIKLIGIGLWATKTCSKFQFNQNMRLRVIAIFCKVCETMKMIKKMKKKVKKLCCREQLEKSYSNFECSFPFVEIISTVNLVPFG